MINERIEEYFQNEVLPQEIIEGFPYPERYCPYCSKKLGVARVVHLQQKEHYKALLVCNNPLCDQFDLNVQKAYTLIYYSSQHARDRLERLLMYVPRKEKR